MFERLRKTVGNIGSLLKSRRIKKHLVKIESRGGIGIDASKTFGIFGSIFLSYTLTEVSPDDIDDFVEAVVALVEDRRMKIALEEQRVEIIRRKIEPLLVHYPYKEDIDETD